MTALSFLRRIVLRGGTVELFVHRPSWQEVLVGWRYESHPTEWSLALCVGLFGVTIEWYRTNERSGDS